MSAKHSASKHLPRAESLVSMNEWSIIIGTVGRLLRVFATPSAMYARVFEPSGWVDSIVLAAVESAVLSYANAATAYERGQNEYCVATRFKTLWIDVHGLSYCSLFALVWMQLAGAETWCLSCSKCKSFHNRLHICNRQHVARGSTRRLTDPRIFCENTYSKCHAYEIILTQVEHLLSHHIHF